MLYFSSLFFFLFFFNFFLFAFLFFPEKVFLMIFCISSYTHQFPIRNYFHLFDHILTRKEHRWFINDIWRQKKNEISDHTVPPHLTFLWKNEFKMKLMSYNELNWDICVITTSNFQFRSGLYFTVLMDSTWKLSTFKL